MAIATGNFEIRAPRAWTSPAIFNSPHSGRAYTAEFLRQSRLSPQALRRSEDCYIDELFAGCLDHGAAASRPCAEELHRSQPRALRTRSAHVRGRIAELRQFCLAARGGGLGTIPAS
jgi:hypothetical protein